MKLTLPGNPKSTNHIYKITCRGKFASMYMSDEGKQLKECYRLYAKTQKSEFFKQKIQMYIKLYFGDKRKRDCDNYSKIILDSMSGIIYEDDKQIYKLTTEKFYDKNNPRVEINIDLY